MLHGMRDNVLALACLRHGLPVREARGVDDLPGGVILPFEQTLAPTLGTAAITGAFAAAIAALLQETRLVDAGLASRLAGPLNALISDCDAFPGEAVLGATPRDRNVEGGTPDWRLIVGSNPVRRCSGRPPSTGMSRAEPPTRA